MPDDPMTLIERLRNPQWVHNPTNFLPPVLDVDQTRCDVDEAANEIERLRSAVAAIKQATLDGKVCDDIAWFDSITTLHDFCEQTLNPPVA